MIAYILLLRAINVGKQNRMKMTELAEMCQRLGFHSVITYLQTGNVYFLTEEESIPKLKMMISEQLFRQFGIDVGVLLFTVAEFQKMVGDCPFEEVAENRVYLTFLRQVPAGGDLNLLAEKAASTEQYQLIDQVFYLYAPAGYSKTKLHNQLIEKYFAVEATTRGLKSCRGLLALADKMKKIE